jgi:hypothetical protein
MESSLVPYMELNGVSSKYLIWHPKHEVNIYPQVLALFEKLEVSNFSRMFSNWVGPFGLQELTTSIQENLISIAPFS